MKRLFLLLILLMLTLCSCNFVVNPNINDSFDDVQDSTNNSDLSNDNQDYNDNVLDDNNDNQNDNTTDDNQNNNDSSNQEDNNQNNDDNQNNNDANQEDNNQNNDDNQNNNDDNQEDNNQNNDNQEDNNQNNDNQDDPSNDDNNNSNDDNQEDNNQNNDNQDDPSNDDNNNSNDDNQEVVRKFLISNPNFETRRINSIDEVTMADFFNLGNRVDIKVSISNSELKKLQSDYETGKKTEIYRLASKVVIILTNYGNQYKWEFENVGIRQKGNTSRQNIINGDGKINMNHYKLSFDETFDDPLMYDSAFISKNENQLYKDREFLGMTGLDFKWNKNHDQTHIREIYANYLYIASGVIAQHSGLSTFSLIETDKNNKETSMGLCTVYEPATKSLIKRS